jgi:hypothetical protein
LTSRAATSTRPDNYDRANLLRRVFEIDVTVCRDCGGPVRVISVINQPTVIKKILDHLGLPSKPPSTEPRGPPGQDDQLELTWNHDHDAA